MILQGAETEGTRARPDGGAGRADGEGPAGAPLRCCAVIVAGGVGARFGDPGGKQLVEVAGRPLLSWSLLVFAQVARVERIVVAAPAEKLDEMRALAVEPLGLRVPVAFAQAGAMRQDSTRAGVEAVPEGFDAVAVHDCARPLIRPQTIDAALDVLAADSSLDGVVCGQPAIDTLKLVGEGAPATDAPGPRAVPICATPDRARYWTVQTPQVFRVDALRRALAAAAAEGFVGTDDSSLVERAGGRVVCMSSPRDNLKVTVPEDLPVVEALLRARNR